MGLMFCRLLTISNHRRKLTGTIEVLDVSSDIHMHVPNSPIMLDQDFFFHFLPQRSPANG